MFELEINGEMYQFNFGMKFMRDINRKVVVPVDKMPDQKKNIGLQYAIANIFDGDIETLVDVLFLANTGMNPRLTKGLLDEYIDSDTTDIDELFETVKDFLSKTNATKKAYKTVVELAENQKAEKA